MSNIGQELVSAGAVGLIQKVLVLLEDVYGSSPLPASYVDLHAASKVFNYLNSDSVRYTMFSSIINYLPTCMELDS